MTERKELAGRLRAMARQLDGKQLRPMARVALEAADLLDSLSPPEGVGLVRYDMQVDDEGRVRAPMRENGGWVRHEDAAAALAAEKARAADLLAELETANREIGNQGRRMSSYHERAEAAEAENKRMAAALGEIDDSRLITGVEAREIAHAALTAQPETDQKDKP